MQVTLVLKEWKVIHDPKTKLPKVAGTYGIMNGEKEIGSELFNDGYGAKELSFGPELMTVIQAADASIRSELEKLLS